MEFGFAFVFVRVAGLVFAVNSLCVVHAPINRHEATWIGWVCGLPQRLISCFEVGVTRTFMCGRGDEFFAGASAPPSAHLRDGPGEG